MSPNPAQRLEAAQSVFKSRDAGALPALEKALAAEQNTSVKQALLDARAALVVGSNDATTEDRIAAIEVIRVRGGQDALSILGGVSPDAPDAVRKAAASATNSVQQSLAIWSAVQNAWYGLSLGSVLLLAAIGLAITFGVMGVINMAHGEMVMLGARCRLRSCLPAPSAS
jgi:urea transport system permease protein